MADVERWLLDPGLAQYARKFVENDIDLDILPDLSEQDLEELGVSLCHRKKLLRAIAALSAELDPPAPVPSTVAASEPRSSPRAEAERRQLTVPQRSGRCARVWRRRGPLPDCGSRRAIGWRPESALPRAWSSWLI